jgi:(1->4)-alpha-D-glucan 1-alpha-D-glucosylmutase
MNFDDLDYRCRKLVIRVALASELNVLADQLTRIALSKRHTCDFTLNSLREALTEVVASFPVYRTYVSSTGVSENDVHYIRAAIASAKWRSPAADTSVFDFIREVLLTHIAEGQDAAYRNAVTAFAMKFQQFTSPVMAKGLEDTAFYRYHRLISLNDVGGDLHRFGITTAEFHAANQDRLRDWPHTMLATSTHDSKRSEDVRARINVLSEIPALWRLRVRDWRRFNRGHRSLIAGKPAPSPNDEYLLYQTLVGAWPSEPLGDANNRKIFCERIQNYILKAIRESKQNTSWVNQNSAYETAVSSFVNALLTPSVKNRFLTDFVPFQRQVARIGLWNSLSQTLLKLTSPGVPDIYQGNDLWDFSLVDPDNRRPVDYSHSQELFEGVRKWSSNPDGISVRRLLETPDDGRLKLYLIWKTLCLRKQWPEVFQRGKYLPLTVQGTRANHVVAFLRNDDHTSVLVVAPRLVAGLLGDSDLPPLGSTVWEETHVLLPHPGSFETYRNAFTGAVKPLPGAEARIPLSELLADFPVALCILGESPSALEA